LSPFPSSNVVETDLSSLYRLQGKAGPGVLDSYGYERRSVAYRNMNRAWRHMTIHLHIWDEYEKNPKLVKEDSPEGEAFRRSLRKYIEDNNGENTVRRTNPCIGER
jgi:hypothetical protein